jgi:hypothetical protein
MWSAVSRSGNRVFEFIRPSHVAQTLPATLGRKFVVLISNYRPNGVAALTLAQKTVGTG